MYLYTFAFYLPLSVFLVSALCCRVFTRLAVDLPAIFAFTLK